LKQVCEAVNTISDVAQGRSAAMNDNGNQIYDGPGELAAALDDFDVIMFYFIYCDSELGGNLGYIGDY